MIFLGGYHETLREVSWLRHAENSIVKTFEGVNPLSQPVGMTPKLPKVRELRLSAHILHVKLRNMLFLVFYQATSNTCQNRFP